MSILSYSVLKEESSDDKLEKLLIVSDIIDSTDDIDSFREKFNIVKNNIPENEMLLLVRSIYAKFNKIFENVEVVKEQQVQNLFGILEILYEDHKKALYEGHMLIAVKKNGVTIEDYKNILQYAQTKEEALKVWLAVLRMALYAANEAEIKTARDEINKLKEKQE